LLFSCPHGALRLLFLPCDHYALGDEEAVALSKEFAQGAIAKLGYSEKKVGGGGDEEEDGSGDDDDMMMVMMIMMMMMMMMVMMMTTTTMLMASSGAGGPLPGRGAGVADPPAALGGAQERTTAHLPGTATVRPPVAASHASFVYGAPSHNPCFPPPPLPSGSTSVWGRESEVAMAWRLLGMHSPAEDADTPLPYQEPSRVCWLLWDEVRSWICKGTQRAPVIGQTEGDLAGLSS
jgi:hypothetical protein